MRMPKHDLHEIKAKGNTSLICLMHLSRLRLVTLFALRYEREGGRQIDTLLQRLLALGVSRSAVNGMECLLNQANASHRVGDLYSDRTFRSRFATMAKQNLRVSPFLQVLPWRRRS